jgi:hypothetical protein
MKDKDTKKPPRRRASYTLCDELEYWIGRELTRRRTLKLRHASKNEILNDWGMAWVNYLRQYYPGLYPANSGLAHLGVAVEVKAVDPADEAKLEQLLDNGIGVGFQKIP